MSVTSSTRKIEPDFLIVKTGYDERMNRPDFSMEKFETFFDDGWGERCELECEDVFLGASHENGAKFIVDDIGCAWDLIQKMYLSQQWYCKCYGVVTMTFNPVTKVMTVELDSESG